MSTTIAVTKEVTTLINVLTFEPENQQKLIELLRGNTKSVVTRLDGWISTSFIAAKGKVQTSLCLPTLKNRHLFLPDRSVVTNKIVFMV